jgi:hypothetical protein
MEQYMKEYEEYKTLGPIGGWVVLILFSAALISFGMIAHMFIMESGQRKWEVGSFPIAPGQTRYSVLEPRREDTTRQMEPFPGAYPDRKLPKVPIEPFSGWVQ